MKHSIYNTTLRITDSSLLLYNALTDRFAVVGSEAEEWLRPTARHDEIPGELMEKLTGMGFFVQDDTDECLKSRNLAMEHCHDSSSFQIIVNPTISCNFRCWYCYEDHDGGTKMSASTVEKVKKLIARKFDDDEIKEVHVSFFGGEPLLYYRDCVRPVIDHLRLCAEASGKSCSVSFTSNGYLITPQVIDHLKEGNEPKSMQITLDGHREQHNKVRFCEGGYGSYDRIVDNIRRLLDCGIKVILRINYTADNISSASKVLNDFKSLPQTSRDLLNVDFQKVWQEDDAVEKADEAEAVIDDFRREFDRVEDYYSRVDSFRHPCYGDMTNGCVVNYNGDVYKCTARDFKGNNRLGRLHSDGKILWDEDDILNKRLIDKFSNPTCIRCRIFPLCGAGCVQTAGEQGFKGCIVHRSEADKDNIVLTRFHNRVVKNKTKAHNTEE